MHAESDVLRCGYCSHEIVPTSDWQMIQKGTPAHTQCAWRVNDEFFAARDEAEVAGDRTNK